MLASGHRILKAVLLSLIVLTVLLVAQRLLGTALNVQPEMYWTSGADSTETIKIHDTVSPGNHGDVPSDIRELISKGVKEIHIDINTPGGSVSTMLEIMNAMDQARANGIRLVCTVTGQAASAGFLIFNHCDKRYAHELANLMWHSVGVYLDGPYNLVSLRALVSSLEAIQFWGNTMIQAQLRLPPEFFSEMWLTELTLTAPQLKALAPHYLEVIPYVAH